MGEGTAAPRESAGAPRLQLALVLLLGVALMAPVVVVPGTFFPYVVPRNILFRVAVELATAVTVLGIALGNRKLDLRGEYVLYALGGFLAALTVSAAFSPAPGHSFFGDFERMGGVLAWLHLALFFLVLRTLDEKYLAWLLYAAVGISIFASADLILERFFAIGSQSATALSIVGNPGLFAGYLLLAIAIAIHLANSNAKYRVALLAAAGVDFVALVMSQNRSSVLGLFAGALAAALVLFLTGDRAASRRTPLAFAVGIGLLATVLVAVMRTAGDSPMASAAPRVVQRMASTSLTGADASRAIQWNAAVAGFRERPVLGYGPENHHLVWSAHFDPRIYDLGTDVFDRTHNAFLEMLATTGILGTIGFLAIWGAIGYSLYRAFRERRVSARELSLLAGANVAYATYLMFWFVDINAAILWMLVTALIAARWRPTPVLRERQRAVSRGVAVASLVACGALLVFALYRHAYVPLRTSIALATLDSYKGDFDRALDAVETASTSRAPQTGHTGPVIGQFIGSLSTRGELETMRADSARRDQLDRTFKRAIAAFEAELRRDPRNDRLLVSFAGTLIDAARFYGSRAYLDRSIRLLNRAIQLSPRRREQRVLLVRAYARRTTGWYRSDRSVTPSEPQAAGRPRDGS